MSTRRIGEPARLPPSSAPSTVRAPTKPEPAQPKADKPVDEFGRGVGAGEPRSRLAPETASEGGGFMDVVRRHPRIAAAAALGATVVPGAVAHAAEAPPAIPTEPARTDLSSSILFGDQPQDAKLIRFVKSLLRSEIYANRDIDVASYAGEYGGVRVAAKARILSPTDPLVAKHTLRSTTTAAAAEAGKPVTWAIAGGGVYPHLNAGFGIPAGPVRIHIGGSARASLDYSVLAPYTVEAGSVLSAAKNLTTRLPFDTASARALPGGAEVSFKGVGRVAAYGGVTGSHTLADVPGFTVGASVGASHESAKEIGLSMVVERMDGDRVKVGLDAWDRTQHTESGHLAVGLDAHVGELLEIGESTLSTTAETVTKLVDQQLERWLKVELRGTHAEWASQDEQGRYIIDLSKPGGQAAYDGLMKRFLSLTGATKVEVSAPASEGVNAVRSWIAAPLAEAPKTDVRSAKLAETSHGNTDATTLHFGPIELLRSVSSAEAKHGTLTTEAGTITYHRAKLTDSHGDILTRWWNGTRDTQREYVTVAMPGQPETSYYRASHRVTNDGITSKNDVRRFVALADMFGALPAESKPLESDKAFLSRFSSSDRVIEVFLSQAGFEKLTTATDDQIHKAFAESFERLDRPWKMDYLWGNDKVWRTTPWLNTSHPKHDDVMWLLKQGPQGQPTHEHGQTRDDQYRLITGRSLSTDAAAYKEANSLVSLVGKLRATQDPAERAEILAAAEEDLDLDIARELATFAKIAGSEDVIVKELRIVDRSHKKDFVLVSEGSLVDPAGTIHNTLANP